MPVIGPVSAAALRDYVAACQPPLADEQQVGRVMTRIANMLPSPRGLGDGEADERMATYRRALSRHALADLHAAYVAILRQCRFFPTIAEVEAIIAPIRAKRMARVHRAEMLIMKHDREWAAPVTDTVTAEEIAALRADARHALTITEETKGD